MLMRPNPGKVRWPSSLSVAVVLAMLCSFMLGIGIALADDPAPAACTITALDTTGLPSTGPRAPNLRDRHKRSVYLILGSEMAAAGLHAGTSFTAIGWSFAVAPGLSGSGPLTVYMQNTSDTTNNKSDVWATSIADMTVVHNDITTIPNVLGPFDIAFSGGSSFTYDGDGLYIAFDAQYPTGDLSTQARVWSTGTLPGGAFVGVALPPTFLARVNQRPLTRLTPSAPAQLNDASVDLVYSLGSLAVPFSGPQAIQAVITNKGANALANLPVTLSITGAESFTDSQVVPALAACGGQTTVTFAPFTPSVIGSVTLTASVPADDLAANDSKSNLVDVTSNLYSYKYPGTTPTTFFAIGGVTGATMNRFTIDAPAKITAVNLEFTSSISAAYRVAIYPDSGSGAPALFPVYEDSVDRSVAANGPVSVALETPVAVGPGTYYAGLEATTLTPVFSSYDYEFPARRAALYYAYPLPVTAWIEDAYDPSFTGDDFQGTWKANIGITLAQCTAGADCDDGNPCTDDSCDSGPGTCVHTNNTASCNDGTACTTSDVCGGGTCHGGAALVCDDNNPCTNDVCNPIGGCGFINNTASCNDGNACTQTDTCQSGTCVGGNPVTCSALDQCHVAGTCDTGTGICSDPMLPNGTSCSDGNACTQTDTCQTGTCTGTNASWSGFLQPVNNDGSSVFKLGSTIPVKFTLTGGCADITNLVANIYFYQVTTSSGPVNEAESTSSADTGTLFRYSGGQYIFNLGTKGLTQGTWQLGVDLHDGVGIRTVPIGLRK